MKTLILISYLYLTDQGEKNVYCRIVSERPKTYVADFGYDNFVTLDCEAGLVNIGIKPDKLNPAKFNTIKSRCLELSQNDKIIAESLFTKVLKNNTDK